MERLNSKKNMVLVGFMGSGKTVIGRAAARALNYEFADTDEEIRRVTGQDLQRLFHKHGEIRFRSEEKLVVNKLAAREGLVIACGGSLPPQAENIARLKENGWVVLLTAQPEVIISRLSRKRDRLLLCGKPTAEEISAIAERWETELSPWFDYKLDSGELDVDTAAEALASAFRNQFPD